MKKVLFIALLMLGVTSSAQEVASNIKLEKVYNLDESSNSRPTYKSTGSTAIYKGVVHPVYITSKGKIFIFVTSKKTGKEYRKYIK